MSAPVANLPTNPTVPDAIVQLVAWYWTEGTDRGSGRVHIVQDHTVNPQHVAAIRSALVEAFGPEREKRKRPDGPLWAENQWCTQATFGLNRAAAAILQEAAPGKVPSIGWLATLTQPQLDLFIERSLNADGHERARSTGRAERVLAQGDQARASAFQAACLIAGHAASMKRYETTYSHGGAVRPVEMWAVTVGMRDFVEPLRQKRVQWVEHHGIVWCPTTPNGTWLARRNGTAYFTGNSGFGGLTRGIEMAGFTTIMAANHNRYKVEVHEANHPHAEHWIADLVDPESSNYHSARDLPAGDFLVAGVSCTNHSQANTVKAYRQAMTLFDLDDPEFEARVTRSERDRATANCVLHYAERHHPRLILIECTTELASWGPAIPGRPKGRRRVHLPVVAQAVREARLPAQGLVPEQHVLRRSPVARPAVHRILGPAAAHSGPGAPARVVVRPLREGGRRRVDVAHGHPGDRVSPLRQAVQLQVPVMPRRGRPRDDPLAARPGPQ